ncbi:MAG: NAD(P)-dependent oxidoreductase [Thermoplasmata archaeon]
MGGEKRTPINVCSPIERIRDFREVVKGYSREEAIEEAKRCLKCKKPACVPSCPVGQRIPEYIAAIAEGNFDKALGIIMENNPLPGVCGRVCTKKCETTCVRGKKGEPIAIHLLKRAAADFGKVELRPLAATGKRVAVVGSGPAGLALSFKLALRGHGVTIFEQKPVAGGMMALCIPPYRLPRDVLDADIRRITDLGVNIQLNSPINRERGVDELFAEGYDAVFLGLGTLKPKSLGIPGEELEGVEHVIPFLESVNLRGRTKVGKRVAVVGAGYSAMDAVRTARRLGAEAFIVYRRMREQMPASQEEVREAEEEGCSLNLLVNPIRVLGKDGKVAGLECVRMELGPPDNSGRPAPIPIKGSEFRIECDMLIQAISQEPDLSGFKPGEFRLTKWNTLEVSETMQTSRRGVWAAGDVVTGPQTIAAAIAGANRAAEDILHFLKGA